MGENPRLVYDIATECNAQNKKGDADCHSILMTIVINMGMLFI